MQIIRVAKVEEKPKVPPPALATLQLQTPLPPPPQLTNPSTGPTLQHSQPAPLQHPAIKIKSHPKNVPKLPVVPHELPSIERVQC
jgi:hypothetical protein